MTATLAKAEHDVERAAAAGTPVLVSPTSHVHLDRPYAEAGEDADAEAAGASARRSTRRNSRSARPLGVGRTVTTRVAAGKRGGR